MVEMQLENKIEAILLFKNEPVSVKEVCKALSTRAEEVRAAIKSLQDFYRDRGIVIVFDGESASFGTHPDVSSLIDQMQKDEYSRELGRAGLETLAIVLYKGPVSRREIDYIRGVNSAYILRTLLIRGLVERTEGQSGERSFTYKPTLKLLEHLGVSRLEDLPDRDTALSNLESFARDQQSDETR